MLRTIFFDAAGTLFHLPQSVGYHYALVGERMGLTLDAAALDRSFAQVWRSMPVRATTGTPRADDDKNWWADLVDRVIGQVAPAMDKSKREAFFEAAYSHFAEPGVWQLYDEVTDVLDQLRGRFPLGIISNFDGRLRVILEHLEISNYFGNVIISSEVGADKPDPLIFHRAAELAGVMPGEALHVGDDRVRDWSGAAAAGFNVFQLDRPRNSLRDVVTACARL